MSEPREPDADKMPDDEELQEPSTEKEPGDEPKDGDSTPEEVDHEAVGIGVVDSAPPTDAASDEVRSDAAGVEQADESGD